ncbi:MAG: hypothetical protein JOZ82_13995, partial [Marmoricola sp.]|nr:hypothetical protein [Marmoricola sp.]
MSEVKASRSAVTVGIGILALGLSASIYLVLAGRAVGPSAFAGLGVQWTLVYTLGIGLFMPFEQEISRQVAHRGELGQGARPVVRKAALAAAGLCAGIVVLVLVTLPWLYDLAFFGNPALVAGLLLALVGLAGQYLMRGTFSGSGAFGCYSAQITTESVVRGVGTIVLFAAGVHSVAPYALLVGVAPIVSVVALARPFR